MKNEFKFKIENFGSINEAEFDLNKLNIVCGANAGGKSFSARLLFCIITALSDDGKRIDNESVKSLFIDFIKRHGSDFPSISSDIKSDKHILTNKLKNLMEYWQDCEVSYEFLDDFYTRFDEILQDFDFENNDFKDDLKKIRHVIDSHSNGLQYIIFVLRFLLMSEFGIDQISNFDGANVNFSIDKPDCKMEYNIQFSDESLTINVDNENQFTFRDFSNVIYMDSLSAMDFQLNGQNIHYHYLSLYNCLSHVQPLNTNGVYDNVDEILGIANKFNRMLNGTFKLDFNRFIFESNGKTYDVKNVSSGYKQIGVLQKLLNNNQISNKTLLILDLPEVNLHSEMQVNLAKLLIEMCKELNIYLYINTHSALLIEAMEVYSVKYGLKEEINFYLSHKNKDTEKFDIKQIQKNKLYEIYNDLGDPYDIIDRIRGENIANHL